MAPVFASFFGIDFYLLWGWILTQCLTCFDALPVRTPIKRELFTLLEHFWIWGGKNKMFKNIFTICSCMQKNTQNPNIKLKIITYSTKYTNNIKIHSKQPMFRKLSKKRKMNWKQSNTFEVLFCYLYNFHSSYFVCLYLLYSFLLICDRFSSTSAGCRAFLNNQWYKDQNTESNYTLYPSLGPKRPLPRRNPCRLILPFVLHPCSLDFLDHFFFARLVYV